MVFAQAKEADWGYKSPAKQARVQAHHEPNKSKATLTFTEPPASLGGGEDDGHPASGSSVSTAEMDIGLQQQRQRKVQQPQPLVRAPVVVKPTPQPQQQAPLVIDQKALSQALLERVTAAAAPAQPRAQIMLADKPQGVPVPASTSAASQLATQLRLAQSLQTQAAPQQQQTFTLQLPQLALGGGIGGGGSSGNALIAQLLANNPALAAQLGLHHEIPSASNPLQATAATGLNLNLGAFGGLGGLAGLGGLGVSGLGVGGNQTVQLLNLPVVVLCPGPQQQQGQGPQMAYTYL